MRRARLCYGVRQANYAGYAAFVVCLALLLIACGGPTTGEGTPQTEGVSGQPTNTPLLTTCGDGLCEQGEEDTCCTDCGCKDPAKICDRYIVRCIDKVVLSEEAKQEILSKYNQWPFIGEEDEVLAGEAVKVFQFNCSDQGKSCVHIVYVDAAGKIVQERETT